jgi:hypothetical protein
VFSFRLIIALRVRSVALLFYYILRNLIDFLSRLYISFSIESLGLALLRYYKLLLHKRFDRESVLLTYVRYLLINYIISREDSYSR